MTRPSTAVLPCLRRRRAIFIYIPRDRSRRDSVGEPCVFLLSFLISQIKSQNPPGGLFNTNILDLFALISFSEAHFFAFLGNLTSDKQSAITTRPPLTLLSFNKRKLSRPKPTQPADFTCSRSYIGACRSIHLLCAGAGAVPLLLRRCCPVRRRIRLP